MKSAVVVLAALLTSAAGLGWAGMPNTTKEFAGVTIDQVADLLERSLEGRKFQILDVAKDDDGNVVIIEAQRDTPMLTLGGGPGAMGTRFRLSMTSTGRVKAVCGSSIGANNVWTKRVWDDLEAAEVAADGTAYCFGKGGKEHVCKAGE